MRMAFMAAIALIVSATAGAAQGVAAGDRMAANPTLTVRGEGHVEVPPDHARLTVEVVTKGKSAEAATAAHRDRATRAAEALRGMQNTGVRIERSVFRLDQIRVPPVPAMPDRFNTEYQAVTSFQLKMSRLDAVDSAVTAIASTGLFEVRNLRFGIDDKNPGLNAARKNAIDDARERATAYAQAAGVKLDAIVRIDETDFRGPREFAVAAPMAGSVQVAPPETLTLSASVTVTWRIGTRP
jgi:hypothetical protein